MSSSRWRCRRRDGDADVVDGLLEMLVTLWREERKHKGLVPLSVSLWPRGPRVLAVNTVVTVVVAVVSVAAVAAGRQRLLHDVFRRLGVKMILESEFTNLWLCHKRADDSKVCFNTLNKSLCHRYSQALISGNRQGQRQGPQAGRYPWGYLYHRGLFALPIIHKSYLNAMSFNNNKHQQRAWEIKTIGLSLKTQNQNGGKRFLR